MQNVIIGYIGEILSNIPKIIHVKYTSGDGYKIFTFELKEEINLIDKKRRLNHKRRKCIKSN